jgi:hypothetical protein
MKLTKNQKTALLDVYRRFESPAMSFLSFRRSVQRGPGCIMVPFHSMWLGIEPDGYTHS